MPRVPPKLHHRPAGPSIVLGTGAVIGWHAHARLVMIVAPLAPTLASPRRSHLRHEEHGMNIASLEGVVSEDDVTRIIEVVREGMGWTRTP